MGPVLQWRLLPGDGRELESEPCHTAPAAREPRFTALTPIKDMRHPPSCRSEALAASGLELAKNLDELGLAKIIATVDLHLTAIFRRGKPLCEHHAATRNTQSALGTPPLPLCAWLSAATVV